MIDYSFLLRTLLLAENSDTARMMTWARRAICLLCLVMLVNACNRQPDPELNIDLRMILPEEWEAVSSWELINIDADPEQEYLLFYHYDASTSADGEEISGPIGAVIYDPQTSTAVPEDAGENTSPPAPRLQPYALLPSYWRGAGYGFVAPPRQVGRPEWLVVQRVQASEIENSYFDVLAQQTQTSGEQISVVPPSDLPPNDELIVYSGSSPIGGPTHISIFWWSTLGEGYGSTQISAPGGLYVEEWDGAANRSPIRTVRARYPQYDRSLLCKESRFQRRLDPNLTSQGAYRAAVYYEEGPRQLVFCYGVPQTPFYPEAVVMAYLLQPDRNASLLVEEVRQSTARTLGTFMGVDALQYLASIDTFASRADTPRPIVTTVWVTLLYEVNGGVESRLYAFTLEHLPSDLRSRTTDQWRVVGVQRQG